MTELLLHQNESVHQLKKKQYCSKKKTNKKQTNKQTNKN